MLETIFLVLLVIVLIVLWYGYNFENRIRYMHIPGPKTQWMLGSCLLLFIVVLVVVVSCNLIKPSLHARVLYIYVYTYVCVCVCVCV